MKVRRIANHVMTLALGLGITHEGGAAPPLPSSHAVFGDEGGATPSGAALGVARASQPPSPSVTPPCCGTLVHPQRLSGDMVRVANRFCIDRYEASMLDDLGSRVISPYYPPVAALLRPFGRVERAAFERGSRGAPSRSRASSFGSVTRPTTPSRAHAPAWCRKDT